MKNILFICTGNTCRSPMAEGIMKDFLQSKEPFSAVNVESAGIAVPFSTPASPHAVTVLKEMGIDIEDHASQLVTKPLLEKADLILTMTERHKQILISAVPDLEGKIYTLKEYAGQEELDIGDPFGGTKEVYRKVALEIKTIIKKIIDKMELQ